MAHLLYCRRANLAALVFSLYLFYILRIDPVDNGIHGQIGFDQGELVCVDMSQRFFACMGIRCKNRHAFCKYGLRHRCLFTA